MKFQYDEMPFQLTMLIRLKLLTGMSEALSLYYDCNQRWNLVSSLF